MAGEVQMGDDAVAGDDHLFDVGVDVRHGAMEALRCSQRPGDALRPTGGQGAVREIGRQRLAGSASSPVLQKVS